MKTAYNIKLEPIFSFGIEIAYTQEFPSDKHL